MTETEATDRVYSPDHVRVRMGWHACSNPRLARRHRSVLVSRHPFMFP